MKNQTGKITKIEQQKKNPERASIFIDGSYAFGLGWDQISNFRLVREMEITPELLQQLQASSEVSKAKNRALAYLERRRRSTHEVRLHLRKKEHPEPVINDVIERLLELGYLNDESFARDYIASRNSSNGYGPHRLRMELIKRGVDREHIDFAMEEFSEEKMIEEVREKAQRKWQQLAKEPNIWKRKQKLAAFLQRRGYGFGSIQTVIESLMEEQ